MGENIGAAARIMQNFDLSHLRVVSPRDGWPNQRAIDMAKGGKNIVEKAQIYDDLEAALADVNLAYGATVRPRDMVKQVLTPKDFVENSNNASVDSKVAIIFGAEQSGLSNEDIALCNGIITIPVGKTYQSLNLAQAVAIVAYEWFASTKSESLGQKSQKLANKNELFGLFGHLEEELDKTNFYGNIDKRPKMTQNIRSLFTRCNLTEQEVRTMRGIIRSLANNANTR